MEKPEFTFRVSDGWLRDLASEPTPHDRWPCIRWDDRLLADQLRFLEVQAELGVEYNLAWGLFVDRAWPVPFENVIDEERERKLKAFVEAAHQRSLKVLCGVGVYCWGFEEVIAKIPGVSGGDRQVTWAKGAGDGSCRRQRPPCMCAFSPEAWDWQRRVLDFLMDARWELDGISMQSADQGRCECEKCRRLSPAEHHAELLVRCADYVRAGRPGWVIGQASWGLRLDDPEDLPHLGRISQAVDYMVEVRELSAVSGRRGELVQNLSCAFGSVGGVFVEPPQHWPRLRWCVPCALGSARALGRLWKEGGRACEYFYRPFANPVEEVSWRTGARILSSPLTPPESALAEAIAAVYHARGPALVTLAEWFARAERAYFSRADFTVGDGPLSLEPLIWQENPAAAGPPVYLRDRMTQQARREYAVELAQLASDLNAMDLPKREARARTLTAIEGTLEDLASLAMLESSEGRGSLGSRNSGRRR